jgi:hypothetical protein
MMHDEINQYRFTAPNGDEWLTFFIYLTPDGSLILPVMRILQTILFLFYATWAIAQSGHPISQVDFVKIKSDHQAEALYFYENNWKAYRDLAIQNGTIKAYKLLIARTDSLATFDLILMTEYADSIQFKYSEENFGKIIKELRPNGPKLMNSLQPGDFRINVNGKIADNVFERP